MSSSTLEPNTTPEGSAGEQTTGKKSSTPARRYRRPATRPAATVAPEAAAASVTPVAPPVAQPAATHQATQAESAAAEPATTGGAKRRSGGRGRGGRGGGRQPAVQLITASTASDGPDGGAAATREAETPTATQSTASQPSADTAPTEAAHADATPGPRVVPVVTQSSAESPAASAEAAQPQRRYRFDRRPVGGSTSGAPTRPERLSAQAPVAPTDAQPAASTVAANAPTQPASADATVAAAPEAISESVTETPATALSPFERLNGGRRFGAATREATPMTRDTVDDIVAALGLSNLEKRQADTLERASAASAASTSPAVARGTSANETSAATTPELQDTSDDGAETDGETSSDTDTETPPSSRRRRRRRRGGGLLRSGAGSDESDDAANGTDAIDALLGIAPATGVRESRESREARESRDSRDGQNGFEQYSDVGPFEDPYAPYSPYSARQQPRDRSNIAQPQQAASQAPSWSIADAQQQMREPESPFAAPEPSFARGFAPQTRGTTGSTREVYPRPGRTERSTDTSAVSASQLGAIMTQAIQQQTDRLLQELRHQQQPPSMTVMLPAVPSTERVGIFVDVANLLYSARSMRISIDFGRLLDFLRGNRRLIRAHAYAPTNPDPNAEQSFLSAVKGLGYRITTKNYKTFSSGAKKADLDLDLCMDIVRLVDAGALDTVVLVSGDSDFLPLLEYCSDHGVRVEAAAFDDSAAMILRQSCDLFINLSVAEDIRA